MAKRDGKPKAYGPFKHGRKYRVAFVTGSGRDRTTTYEVFDSRTDAQACHDAANDEAQGLTVSAAIKAWIDVQRAKGLAPLTIEAYEGRATALLAEYLHRPVRSIQHRGSELYAGALAGRRADSHQNLLTVGGLWGKWCVKQKWLKSDPFADVDPVGKRVHGADKARLTIDESRKLESWCVAHPSDQGAALTLGYLYLGSRNTEMATNRVVRDLDDGGTLLLIGKTKSDAGRRSLRIPGVLADMLRAMTAGRPVDAPIFTGSRGQPMNRHAARLHVRRVCRLAGVTVLPPQALRRTQASLATEAGETSLAVARHLGHASAQVAEESYVGRDVTSAAQGERALRVIRGGRP